MVRFSKGSVTTSILCVSNHHNGKTKNEPSHCLIEMSLAKGPILYHTRSKDRKFFLKSTPILWHLLHMQALGKFSGNSKQLLTNTHPKERTRHFSHISSCLKCSFFGKEEKKEIYFWPLNLFLPVCISAEMLPIWFRLLSP